MGRHEKRWTPEYTYSPIEVSLSGTIEFRSFGKLVEINSTRKFSLQIAHEPLFKFRHRHFRFTFTMLIWLVRYSLDQVELGLMHSRSGRNTHSKITLGFLAQTYI